MLEGILNALKIVATALGWMKQKSDQETGAALQRGAENAGALEEVEKKNAVDEVALRTGVGGERDGMRDFVITPKP